MDRELFDLFRYIIPDCNVTWSYLWSDAGCGQQEYHTDHKKITELHKKNKLLPKDRIFSGILAVENGTKLYDDKSELKHVDINSLLLFTG